jgi:pimeloyl-ACP methyl ester carboxylesterase
MFRIVLLALVLAPGLLFAQPFPIGSRSVTFYDATRDRDVPCQVRYPGATAGSNVPMAQGSFPVLVIGHGFLMSVDAYANLWDHFVPKGYICVLPTTEGGFPDHGAFGEDLAFVAQAMQAAGADDASPFFGGVAPTTALMGHSMGGGASFLAAAQSPTVQALVNFAAAETNPSAIAAAASVTMPTLVFAGTNDCVTPVDGNQAPMYGSCASACKAFVNIIDGRHCFFANYNLACSTGELTCGGASITRAAQHDVVNDFASLWLDHFLKGDADAFTAFSDSVATSVRVEADLACISTGLASITQAEHIVLHPVPSEGLVNVSGGGAWSDFRVVDAVGRCVLHGPRPLDVAAIDMTALPDGRYQVLLFSPQRVERAAVVISRRN